MSKQTILVTGATGFIGSQLVAHLLKNNGEVVRQSRHSISPVMGCRDVIKQVNSVTDWSDALAGVTQVVHCAARVHMMDDADLESYREVNTYGTLNLAKQAAEAGVKRFIFLSTIGVNGNRTVDVPFNEDDVPKPHNPYATSKFEAEVALYELAQQTKMDVVIIRPPLVYGGAVKGNFVSLVSLIQRYRFLPFGAINNKRAMLALDNLVDFISLCIRHPKAANEVFIISDDNDISTTEFIRAVANALCVRIWLIPVSSSFFKLVLNFLGKRQMADSLFSSLELDITKAKTRLEWQPEITLQQQLKKLQQRK